MVVHVLITTGRGLSIILLNSLVHVISSTMFNMLNLHNKHHGFADISRGKPLALGPHLKTTGEIIDGIAINCGAHQPWLWPWLSLNFHSSEDTNQLWGHGCPIHHQATDIVSHRTVKPVKPLALADASQNSNHVIVDTALLLH